MVNMMEREWESKGREEGLTIGREEGLTIGREEGFAKGRMEVLFKYVAGGYIPIEVAAEELKMSVGDFKKAMERDLNKNGGSAS